MDQLPQIFEVEFKEVEKDGTPHVSVFYNGMQIGNDLDDNTNTEDGYRYHDCFHLIYFVRFGSSHVMDVLLGIEQNKKMQRPPQREIVTEMQTSVEEALPLMSFNLRQKETWVKADKPVPAFLDIMCDLAKTAHIDPVPSHKEMSDLIGDFYKNIDLLHHNRGGILVCDRTHKTVTYKNAS